MKLERVRLGLRTLALFSATIPAATILTVRAGAVVPCADVAPGACPDGCTPGPVTELEVFAGLTETIAAEGSATRKPALVKVHSVPIRS